MSNSAEKERYPLATQEGNYIPLEVAEALGYAPIAFNDIASSLLSFPTDTEIITVLSDQPCLISFGAEVPTIVDATWVPDTYQLPKNVVAFLHVPQDKTSISVMRDGANNGTLKVNAIRNWRALKQTLSSRSM